MYKILKYDAGGMSNNKPGSTEQNKGKSRDLA